jgi:hypothetical protein
MLLRNVGTTLHGVMTQTTVTCGYADRSQRRGFGFHILGRFTAHEGGCGGPSAGLDVWTLPLLRMYPYCPRVARRTTEDSEFHARQG